MAPRRCTSGATRSRAIVPIRHWSETARFGAAARSVARAQAFGSPRAARRRFSRATDDLHTPTGARGDGGSAARRAGPRARSPIGAQRRIVLSRRGVGDRHRNGVARGRRREGANWKSGTRRRNLTSSSFAGFCARWAYRSRGKARRPFVSNPPSDSRVRRTGSMATTSRPGVGEWLPQSRVARSR